MTTPQYIAYGALFASPIELHGFSVAADDSAAPRIPIRFGPVPERLEPTLARGGAWVANRDEVIVTHPGTVRYRVRRNEGIDVEPHSDVGSTDTFLQGIPIAASLMFAGRTVLHGAAAEIDGAAVLLVGANGSGKSSSAAALVDLGGRAVCDNLAVLELSEGDVLLHAGPASMRLWPDMAEALAIDVSRAATVSAETTKYILDSATHRREPARLRAIVTIAVATVEHPNLERLSVAAATAALVHNHFRGKLARAVAPETLGAAATIAQQVPVFALQRPPRGYGPRQLATFLRTSLDEAGLP